MMMMESKAEFSGLVVCGEVCVYSVDVCVKCDVAAEGGMPRWGLSRPSPTLESLSARLFMHL